MVHCFLCNKVDHIAEKCPFLDDAQRFIWKKIQEAKAKTNVVPFEQIPEKVTVNVINENPWSEFVFNIKPIDIDKNMYGGFLSKDGIEEPVELWSGVPGLLGRSKLQFQNSTVFEIRFGKGMIARCGGPGNYDIIPDHLGRIIQIVETDSNNEITTVYIDVEECSATIGEGWITDFEKFN